MPIDILNSIPQGAQPALKMQIKGGWGTSQQAFCNAKVAVVYTTAWLAMRSFEPKKVFLKKNHVVPTIN